MMRVDAKDMGTDLKEVLITKEEIDALVAGIHKVKEVFG